MLSSDVLTTAYHLKALMSCPVHIIITNLKVPFEDSARGYDCDVGCFDLVSVHREKLHFKHFLGNEIE